MTSGIPKHLAVTIYLVFEEKVLLISHRKSGKWLGIGGHVEEDEDPIEALLREIEEESGFSPDEVTLVSLTDVGIGDDGVYTLPVPFRLQVENIDDKHHHIDLIYAGTVSHDRIQLEEDAHDDIRWFSVDEMQAAGVTDEVIETAATALEMVS